jgi:two-component system, NtrC family, sensor kinase
MKMGINIKLVTFTILLIVVPAVILGLVGFKAAQTAFYSGINDRLKDQAKDWRMIVEAYDQEIAGQQARVKVSAQNIVTAQAKATYEFIDKAFKDNGGKLPDNVKEDVLNRLNRNTVGKTGYIWILDYKGKYVLSKGRQRDGENVWETKDSDGNMVIQDLINKGMLVKGSEIAYHSYPWLNNGETIPREKIAAMINFPELQWVVGISTYYDDLVDMGYKERTIEHVKDQISKQLIGATGYIWVLDSKGNYVVSKGRLRDGENVWETKDSDGKMVIQDLVNIGKGLKPDEQGLHVYPWLNKGETSPRLKVAGMSYYENWDWVIGVSAYYDDFQGGGAIGQLKNTLIIVSLIIALLGAIVGLFIANRISKPLRKLTAVGRQIADGELDAEVPHIKTGDEVEDLGVTMEMLVGAIKTLKKK